MCVFESRGRRALYSAQHRRGMSTMLGMCATTEGGGGTREHTRGRGLEWEASGTAAAQASSRRVQHGSMQAQAHHQCDCRFWQPIVVPPPMGCIPQGLAFAAVPSSKQTASRSSTQADNTNHTTQHGAGPKQHEGLGRPQHGRRTGSAPYRVVSTQLLADVCTWRPVLQFVHHWLLLLLW